jgi:UDP-N-acetylmuramate--alanine ligase
MNRANSYFFCGIGGSGMLPLACILRAAGHEVAGSDRALDQGRTADKFEYLKRLGIALFPQNGSGIHSAEQLLVTSAAIEENVPDVEAAKRVGADRISRPELLARLLNETPTSIAVGGTSGKSTVTGMIGWILHCVGREPTVMNGAVMKNFISEEAPFASALVGGGDIFVSEVDESDGSIALYHPSVAVLGNITLDHKSMDELRRLFSGFIAKADKAVLNLDDEETRLLSEDHDLSRRITFSLSTPEADFAASDIAEEPFAITFTVTESDDGSARVSLPVPGRHNAANALAAIAAARSCGIDLAAAAEALSTFAGLRRRFELVGQANGVSVIDDFGHNPDKIAATLSTLHAFPGRLLIFFQPHGFGPLRTMKQELIDCFAQNLGEGDLLLMPDPVYHGGTTDRSVGSDAIVQGLQHAGRDARHVKSREEAADILTGDAKPSDRIVVMGARDDTLAQFAADLLGRLKAR